MRAMLIVAMYVGVAACDGIQGPQVQSRFSTTVEAEVVYTDGTFRSKTFRPCDAYRFFPLVSGFRPPERNVFVASIGVSRRGTALLVLDGEELEGSVAPDGIIAVDEAGIRRIAAPGIGCATLLSAFDAPVQVDVDYDDGTTWSTTWEPCRTYLWESKLGRRGIGEEHANAHEMVITMDGDVVHRLDAHAINRTFSAYLKKQIPFAYIVDESGFKEVDRREVRTDDLGHEQCASRLAT